MRFLFTCGGTAGHINPAVGVAGQLKLLFPEAEFLFIGARDRMEMELVPREGYRILPVDIDNLSRSLSLEGLKHNLHTVRSVADSTGAAKKILREFRPDAVIGTGGYVCFPVLRAAHALGIPALVHESNAVPGLTTKLLSRTVDCVMVGFPGVAERYPRGVRVEYTGTPVRTEFRTGDPGELKARLGLPPERPLLVSVWGSLGSGHINSLMPEFLRLAGAEGRFTVIHSAGKAGYPALAAAAAAACGGSLPENTDLRPYIFNMPEVMAAADLVMCRSGASTLAELAALKKPALLVPSPNVTNHHQEKNARLLESLGAARVLLEGEFDARGLYDAAARMLSDPAALASMAEAMGGSGAPDAAQRIAELILEFL